VWASDYVTKKTWLFSCIDELKLLNSVCLADDS
jgi:hypothetical protein